ncbi:MAG: hypothetical protein ACXVIG_07210 [Halobacteriota archaeon]
MITSTKHAAESSQYRLILKIVRDNPGCSAVEVADGAWVKVVVAERRLAVLEAEGNIVNAGGLYWIRTDE